eukprot:CAMPEP_0206212838 /NCGR_PEP_ID=MMETSP0047_2-20121206/792_1 /ASSEMBLY_ACC=CAM_ASM_000192 /TAXON_ID=195065 /ORGANISM="Chroomonas mesostigmatica_cf, Strain CCMP1168" /LENGTH=198 /DNA_ID=CAMNT_0053634927 /DNA_START=1827 /DNA_END=2425 /DNA_ORIENTATION=-
MPPDHRNSTGKSRAEPVEAGRRLSCLTTTTQPSVCVCPDCEKPTKHPLISRLERNRQEGLQMPYSHIDQSARHGWKKLLSWNVLRSWGIVDCRSPVFVYNLTNSSCMSYQNRGCLPDSKTSPHRLDDKSRKTSGQSQAHVQMHPGTQRKVAQASNPKSVPPPLYAAADSGIRVADTVVLSIREDGARSDATLSRALGP